MHFRSLIIFLVLFSCHFSMAQDTTKTKEETKKYSKIQVYSNKHKFTKFIYKLIFEPIYKSETKKTHSIKLEKQNLLLTKVK